MKFINSPFAKLDSIMNALDYQKEISLMRISVEEKLIINLTLCKPIFDLYLIRKIYGYDMFFLFKKLFIRIFRNEKLM